MTWPKKMNLSQADRHLIAQAQAKVIAYKQIGHDKTAAEWARKLIELLGCQEILNDDAAAYSKGDRGAWDNAALTKGEQG
jgi:hypothetical protein